MNRIVVLIIFIAALIGVEFYVFQGYKLLVKRWLPDYSKTAHYIYWLVPIILFASIIVLNFVVKNPGSGLEKLQRWLSTILIMVYLAKVVWLVFIVIDDIVRLIRFLFSASSMPNEEMIGKISRSQFIVSAGALAGGALFGGLSYGIIKGAHNYQVLRRNLRIKGLPDSLEGLRIVQISDIHSGSFWSHTAVQKGVDMIVEQDPDLVFFTGDLVNNKAEEFDGFKEMFSKIKAKYGVFSVLGNHDYGDYVSWPDRSGLTKEENLARLKKHHHDIGWKLLMNEHAVVNHNGEEIAIIGIENWSSHPRFPKYGNLETAYQGAENYGVKLLLSHDPSHWKAEVREKYKDIQATFSGHTHGMQFGVDTKYYRWSPVKYQYKEWADLYEESDQALYVNRGFGYLGYPGRLGFYPEITVFELTKA